MSIIKISKILFEYIRRDSEGNPKQIKTALDHVDLDVREGEFIAVLGANGSGKSTLARHLNALLTPEEGAVVIGGMDTKAPENVYPVRRNVGMVFQNPDNQIVGSIVEEDVGFGPENLGLETTDIWDRVANALEATGMWACRMKTPDRLSGGQKQRVAIAGVLAMRPRVIVLDEATAMLDPAGRREVMESVMELNRSEHVTVILITHHMDEAAMAQRIIVMKEGAVAMDGAPKEIFSRYEELSGLGLDVPDTVRLSHILRSEGMPLPEGIITREEMASALTGLLKES